MSKIFFHAHTDHSPDSKVKLNEARQKLASLGIDTLFLTNHNQLDRSISDGHPTTVIAGEEITTSQGEIIGIFLTQRIPPGLSLHATLERIHAQEGLAVAPHPFDRWRSQTIPIELLQKHLSRIDIIEVFNARTVFSQDNLKALEFAKRHQKPLIYGGDAHIMSEYGLTWMDGVDISGPSLFLASLATVQPHIQKAPLIVHLITKIVKWQRRINAKNN